MRAATIWYYTIRARFEVGILWKMQTARYFVRLAWLALRGKLLIVDSERTTSRGGFKYLAIIISKTPVSEAHTYDDL